MIWTNSRIGYWKASGSRHPKKSRVLRISLRSWKSRFPIRNWKWPRRELKNISQTRMFVRQRSILWLHRVSNCSRPSRHVPDCGRKASLHWTKLPDLRKKKHSSDWLKKVLESMALLRCRSTMQGLKFRLGAINCCTTASTGGFPFVWTRRKPSRTATHVKHLMWSCSTIWKGAKRRSAWCRAENASG